MRQTASYTLPSPWRQIIWSYVWLAAAMTAALVCDWGCSAHGGELSFSDSSRQPIRRLRKETRITVLRPIRARSRGAAGYPFLQSVRHTTKAVANVTGLFNPIGWFFR